MIITHSCHKLSNISWLIIKAVFPSVFILYVLHVGAEKCPNWNLKGIFWTPSPAHFYHWFTDWPLIGGRPQLRLKSRCVHVSLTAGRRHGHKSRWHHTVLDWPLRILVENLTNELPLPPQILQSKALRQLSLPSIRLLRLNIIIAFDLLHQSHHNRFLNRGQIQTGLLQIWTLKSFKTKGEKSSRTLSHLRPAHFHDKVLKYLDGG